jgi:hypothetical protein
MEWFTAERLVSIVAVLAVLFLVGRGVPGRRWPLLIAVTLAIVAGILVIEQNGLWPRSWMVR